MLSGFLNVRVVYETKTMWKVNTFFFRVNSIRQFFPNEKKAVKVAILLNAHRICYLPVEVSGNQWYGPGLD